MSHISNRIEALAELHCIDVLWLQEFYLECLAIMEADKVANAESLALDCIQAELEGRK